MKPSFGRRGGDYGYEDGMRRRIFLALVGTSLAALATGVPQGDQEWCLIELTYHGEPVTKPMRTVFRMNSRMTATFWSGIAFLCDGVTMRREGEFPLLHHEFEVIQFTPFLRMDVSWLVTDHDLTVQELVDA